MFVRQAEGRDGSGLVLDPEPSAHGAITLVEKDAAKTLKRPNSRERRKEKGAEARGLQFGLQGGDAKRQTRRLLEEVGQIAVVGRRRYLGGTYRRPSCATAGNRPHAA